MTMNKKLLTSALATAMLMSFCACSKQETAETTGTTTEETTATTTQSEPVPETTAESTKSEIVIPDIDLESLSTFTVTSEDLHDGVWDDVISNTSAGENKSPELSWDTIDGASMYVVYMIDTSAGNWMHLKATDITTPYIEGGSLNSLSYVGPYPPSGTHDYVVYVFALKSNPIAVKGLLDINNTSLTDIFSSLDVNDEGASGNIISYGMLTGTYSAK